MTEGTGHRAQGTVDGRDAGTPTSFSHPRTIAAVSGARSDYGILLPVMRALQPASGGPANLQVIATGMHLAAGFGDTLQAFEEDGLEVAERVEMLLAGDSGESTALSMGLGTLGMARALARLRPDILLLCADRFETHAAAVAAVPLRIPVAHLHGGEVTEGAFDDCLRHSITKLSHLHFVATEAYARRVAQLGEEPWRIRVSGAPALDLLLETPMMTRAQIEQRLGFPLRGEFLLVTYHPPTLAFDPLEDLEPLLAAIRTLGPQTIFTAPNADPGGRAVASRIRAFVESEADAHLVLNAGQELYANLMRQASAMAGNSSSAIIEAPSFGLPALNVGLRQRGRVRAANVINVEEGGSEAMLAALRTLTSPAFRAELAGAPNPYYHGGAANCIARRLLEVDLESLIPKRFVDRG